MKYQLKWLNSKTGEVTLSQSFETEDVVTQQDFKRFEESMDFLLNEHMYVMEYNRRISANIPLDQWIIKDPGNYASASYVENIRNGEIEGDSDLVLEQITLCLGVLLEDGRYIEINEEAD